MAKSIWCRVGMHRWETRSNPDGGRYVVCKHCNKENSHISGAAAGGTM